MKSFNEIKEEITQIWNEQEEMARKADVILQGCEKLEQQIIDLLAVAETEYPKEYKEYLSSFGPKEKEEEVDESN